VQVYALSKERDALRRGSDKLTSATDLLKEKDDIIKQVWGCSLRLHGCPHKRRHQHSGEMRRCPVEVWHTRRETRAACW